MADDTKKLEEIKNNISTAYLYFKSNYERYRFFRQYVFKESITDRQRVMLRRDKRPDLEFNILESYISRLLGEFAKSEPSINVTPSEGVPVDQAVIDLTENHFRHILHEANKNQFSYEVYKDLLSGGFSVSKVHTDYDNPMSFKQNIYVTRVFDPTLCGFDPMARNPSKSDGNFCFEIFPFSEKDFKAEFPNVALNKLKYSTDLEGFTWSYKDVQNNKVILVADYYEKKKKRVKIVQLADGTVMTAKKYKKLEEYWIAENIIEQIPLPVGKPRMTVLETICRYRIVENEIIEYEELDFAYFPLVFIDGNSVILSDNRSNTSYQMTKPYVYHAKGIQELKNFAGQCLGNYLQTMVQHKFIIKKEAIVQQEDSLEALKNIQRANTVIVNAYSENNPEKPIPEPIREVQNVPAPPEVMGTFQVTDPTTQAILGSFASNLGKNDNDLSGKAVIESSTVGNAAAMPYVVGYLAGLTHIANVCLDLMPKYLVGKRRLPIKTKDGKQDYQEVNIKGAPKLDYNEGALKVEVEAGVNFQVQKNQAVQQIIALAGSMPIFGEFINSEDGMPILLKNLTIYGADSLQEMVRPWFEKRQQQQQQAQEMQAQAMQNDPQIIRAQTDQMKAQLSAQIEQGKQQIEMMRLEMEKQQNEIDNQLKIAKLSIDKIIADSKIMESEAKISQAQIDSAIKLEENETSLSRHALDAAAKMAEIQSREHNDGLATKHLEHQINLATKNNE